MDASMMQQKNKPNYTQGGSDSLHFPLPYPQTVQSARALIYAHGLTISAAARRLNLPRNALEDLLIGRGKGRWGRNHLAALALGIAPPVEAAAVRP
jgi:gp16 family phage-associated protein